VIPFVKHPPCIGLPTVADLRYQAQHRTQEELLAHLKSFSFYGSMGEPGHKKPPSENSEEQAWKQHDKGRSRLFSPGDAASADKTGHGDRHGLSLQGTGR
jgi:hypothetical protein